MNLIFGKFVSVICLIVAVVLCLAATPGDSAASSLKLDKAVVNSSSKVLLVVVDVAAVVYTAKKKEQREDWADEVREQVLNAFRVYFDEDSTIELKVPNMEGEKAEELEEITSLFRVVDNSTSFMLSKVRHDREFTYHIGPVDRLLDHYDADVIMFVNMSTSDTPFRTKFFYAVVGVYVTNYSYLGASIIEPSGKLVWWAGARSRETDLKEAEAAREIVGSVMSRVPLATK